MRKYWSKEEEQFLRENYGKIAIKDLAVMFNTTYVKVVDKAHKMGLNSRVVSGDYWTPEEDAIIIEHFEWAPKNYLLRLLPNRTWCAIRQRGFKTFNLNRLSRDKYDIDYRFFEKLTPESAYVLGLVAADGYLKIDHGARGDTALQFEMAEYDRDILDKVKLVMRYEGPVTVSKRNTVKLCIANRKICLDLEKHGIPRTNKTEKLEWPVNLSADLVLHFTRGLFDGDGSVYDDKGISIQFLNNSCVLEALKELLPTQSKVRVRKRNYGNVWDLQYSNRKAVDILIWMYQDATIYLDRKYKKTLELFDKYGVDRGLLKTR